MKKLLCLLAISGILTASNVYAQDAKKSNDKQKPRVEVRQVETKNKIRPAEERATDMSERIAQKLSLNTDVRKKIYDVCLESAQKIDELRANRDQDLNGFKTAIKDAHAEREGKILKLLTPEQQRQFDAMKKALRDKRLNSK